MTQAAHIHKLTQNIIITQTQMHTHKNTNKHELLTETNRKKKRTKVQPQLLKYCNVLLKGANISEIQIKLMKSITVKKPFINDLSKDNVELAVRTDIR